MRIYVIVMVIVLSLDIVGKLLEFSDKTPKEDMHALVLSAGINIVLLMYGIWTLAASK